MVGPATTRTPPAVGLIRVLGVDPAAAGPTGYAVLESNGKHCCVLRYGALRVPARRQKSSPCAVLHDIHSLLSKLLDEFAPNALAVESVFSALNVRTALRLAEVRGVVLLAAEQHSIPVYSYSPREVKASIAGYGHADKRQMQITVRALLEMREIPEPSHAADALAIALCYLQGRKLEERFGVVIPGRRRPLVKALSDSIEPATSGPRPGNQLPR